MLETNPLERIRQALRDHGSRPSGNGSGSWICPAHDDRDPSLSIREGDDGRALVHCHGGCSTEAVVSAIGLTIADLFAVGVSSSGADLQPSAAAPRCTLQAYAEAKRLPIGFLQKLGLRDQPYQRGTALRIPYLDEGEEETATRYRLHLDAEAGPRFRWRTGSKPVPYGLHRLANAQALGSIVLVEGESDAQTLWFHGIPALGIPGASTWRSEWAEALDGLGTVFVVLEPDQGGDTFLSRLLTTPTLRDRLRIVTLPTKDASELHMSDPDAFEQIFAGCLDSSTVAVEEERAAAEAEDETRRREAWERCADLARHPRILDRAVETLGSLGLSGEARAASLLILVLVSRLLERLVSGILKGPSSAGKSWVIDCVLRLFPPSAVYSLTGASERFLLYDEEPIAHRHVMVSEAAGIEGDFAAYVVRTLLSEGRLVYGTVEKNQHGKLAARRIVREGPTGLLLTTTRVTVHPENETRLLSIPVDDTPEQTQRVLLSLAKELDDEVVDLSEWHALQDWLALDERRVTIPFAQALAGLINPAAVRLRRDFGALLALVRAHALLHRANRDADAGGRIVAVLDDYDVVRELVADLMAEAAESTVSQATRSTVKAVAGLLSVGVSKETQVTVRQLAERLELDRSVAYRRFRKAAADGFLRNEAKRGQPLRIVLGDPLPEDNPLLPSAAELEAAWRGDHRPEVVTEFEEALL